MTTTKTQKPTKKICLYRNHKFLKSFYIDQETVCLHRYDPLPYIFQAVDFDDLFQLLMGLHVGFKVHGGNVIYRGEGLVLREFFHWFALVYKKYFGCDGNCTGESLYGVELGDLYKVLFNDKEFRKALNREVYKELLK